MSHFPWGSPEDNWGRNGLQMLVTPLCYGPLGAHSGFVTRLHQALRFRGSNRWPLTCHSTPPISIHHTPVWWHITWINITPICFSQLNHPNTEHCSLPRNTIWNHFSSVFSISLFTPNIYFLMKCRLWIWSSFWPKDICVRLGMIKPLGLYKSQQTSQVKVFIFECGSSEQISEARSIYFIKTCFKLGVNLTTMLVKVKI